MQNNKRQWENLKVSDRLSVSLNPIRHWAENVTVENEKKYQQQDEIKRPSIALRFLMGDPTRYPQFVTPLVYRQIIAKGVGKINGYTDFFGDPWVRTELASKLSNSNWLLSKDDIILTMGGSLALYYCVYAMCNKGDKILMPKPTFPLLNSYAEFLGVETLWYSLQEKNGWQPNFEEIEDHLQNNKDIRFIMVNSPSNPLGSVLTKENILRLLEICEKYNDLPIVADEIYEDMVWEGEFKFISDYTNRVPVLRCSGLTKKALVPGWRMGWLAFFGKEGVFDDVKRGLRGITNVLLMPNTVCQASLNDVYESTEHFITNGMKEMGLRFQTVKQRLMGVEGLSVGNASGAMYATISIDPEQFKDIDDSKDFACLLQIEENVLVFPGELFYGKNFIRLVICAEIDQLDEACTRIIRLCDRHRIKQ